MSQDYKHKNKTVQAKSCTASRQKTLSVNTRVGVILWQNFLSNKHIFKTLTFALKDMLLVSNVNMSLKNIFMTKLTLWPTVLNSQLGSFRWKNCIWITINNFLRPNTVMQNYTNLIGPFGDDPNLNSELHMSQKIWKKSTMILLYPVSTTG